MNARERLALQAQLTALGTKPLRGSFFRFVDEAFRYAPISSFSSQIWGNRYNRALLFERPSFGALYLANTQANALLEIEAISNGAPKATSPRSMLTIDVDLLHVVDIRDAAAYTTLNAGANAVTFADLIATWRLKQRADRTVTQEIGAAAYNLGLEGLLVPSARVPEAFNLVVIDENMLTRSSLQVYITIAKRRLGRDSLTGRK